MVSAYVVYGGEAVGKRLAEDMSPVEAFTHGWEWSEGMENAAYTVRQRWRAPHFSYRICSISENMLWLMLHA